MKSSLALFWRILSFRQGPETAPASASWLAALIVLNLAVTLLILLLDSHHTRQQAIVLPLLSQGIDLGALWLLLHFKNVGRLWTQMATVITGCDLVLAIASLPIALLLDAVPKGTRDFLELLVLLLVAWGLGLRAFIYHRTLRIGLVQANMLALSLYLLTVTLSVKVFPELLAQAPS